MSFDRLSSRNEFKTNIRNGRIQLDNGSVPSDKDVPLPDLHGIPLKHSLPDSRKKLRLALLLSADAFEGFFGEVIGIGREEYLASYRHDFSWCYANALKSVNVEVIIYVASWSNSGIYSTADGYQVRFLPLRRFYQLWQRFPKLGRTPLGRYAGQLANALAFAPSLKNSLKSDYIDALYVQDYWNARFDLISITIGKWLPVIGADHGGSRRRQITLLKRKSFSRAAAMTAQTRNECVEVSAFGTQAHYLPNGVDCEFYQPSGQPRAKTILTVARLTDGQKRVSDLIRTLPLLPAEWRLKIAGRGPDLDQLLALVQKLGLSNRVDFLGFVNDREKLRGLYCTCGVFALASANEGLPMAMLEAMSCGTSVVASSIRAFDGLVEHGKTGVRVAVGDIDSIAEGVQLAWGERLAWGNAARQLIHDKYSQAMMAQRIRRLLDDAIKLPPS